MARERNLRVGPYLLAAVLFGASAMQASVAEEPHSGTRALDQLRQHKPATRSVAPKNPLARRGSVPQAAERLARNAIGAIVARHEGVQGHDGDFRGWRIAVPMPGATAAGSARGMPNNVAKTDDRIDGPNITRPITGLPVGSAVLNRRAINGTGLVHPGFGPSGIGGPVKTTAGINGSTFRSKH